MQNETGKQTNFQKPHNIIVKHKTGRRSERYASIVVKDQ